jgi:hypothetical protein
LDHYSPVIEFHVIDHLRIVTAESLISQINPIFNMAQLTSADIHCKEMSVHMLIKILNALPNINLIRLSDLPLRNAFNQCAESLDILEEFLKTNRITKLTLQNITIAEQIDLIIDLFPRIEYLCFQHIWNADFQFVVYYTLWKIKANNILHPMTICIFGIEVEYHQVKTLHRMIDLNNLLNNYTIQRQYERFYLQWK